MKASSIFDLRVCRSAPGASSSSALQVAAVAVGELQEQGVTCSLAPTGAPAGFKVLPSPNDNRCSGRLSICCAGTQVAARRPPCTSVVTNPPPQQQQQPCDRRILSRFSERKQILFQSLPKSFCKEGLMRKVNKETGPGPLGHQ